MTITGVGKLTCCLESKLVRISTLNVLGCIDINLPIYINNIQLSYNIIVIYTNMTTTHVFFIKSRRNDCIVILNYSQYKGVTIHELCRPIGCLIHKYWHDVSIKQY